MTFIILLLCSMEPHFFRVSLKPLDMLANQSKPEKGPLKCVCIACHLIVRDEIDHHHRLCCASHNAYTERQSMSCFLQLIICKLQFDVGI